MPERQRNAPIEIPRDIDARVIRVKHGWLRVWKPRTRRRSPRPSWDRLRPNL